MENYLRITDKAIIEASLEDETEYEFVGQITTCGKNTTPDGEGSELITHKARFTGSVTLIKGDKTLIKGRDKTKASQRLRWAIEAQARQEGAEDVEQFYQNEINRLIQSYK